MAFRRSGVQAPSAPPFCQSEGSAAFLQFASVAALSWKLANTPRPRHSNAMKTTVELDASNRIVRSRELRQAAGIPRRQKLIVSATPGRIVLEMEANASGRVIKRGKLKVWTGAVPTTSIEEAVEHSRHYTR